MASEIVLMPFSKLGKLAERLLMTISMGTWEGHYNCDILISFPKLGPEERTEWSICWQGVQLSCLSCPTSLGGCFLLHGLDCMASESSGGPAICASWRIITSMSWLPFPETFWVSSPQRSEPQLCIYCPLATNECVRKVPYWPQPWDLVRGLRDVWKNGHAYLPGTPRKHFPFVITKLLGHS